MEKFDKSVILLVDDKPANLFALENMLAGEGKQIITANSGKEALTTILNKEIDLIILDVHMPEMDGFEVAQILKSTNRTKNIPIIFASAEKKEYSSVLQGYDEGAVDYLVKPLDPTITRAKVAILLELQLQKRELIEKNLSLQKSELLINNSADIIGIIDIATLTFEKVNVAFNSILGYATDEILGKHFTFFLYDKYVDAITMNNQRNKEHISFETRVICKDQSSKWLDWNIIIKYGKWFFNARDITAAKETEKIKDFLGELVRHSNNAVYIHDEEGKIISWNIGAENIYGYKEAEALKMQVWELLPENIRSSSKDIVDKIINEQITIENNKIEEFETKRLAKNGKIIDVIFSANVITDYTGERKSFAIKEIDITKQNISNHQIAQLNVDLKKNIIQLEASNKELESFSYSVSHDLRAPLRAVNGYVRIIEEDYDKQLDEEGKRLLHNIQSNAERMGALIDDLLAFSRLGRKEVEMNEINFDKLIEAVSIEINNSGTHTASIKINTLDNALGDYSLLRQVWTNLLSNAIKYSAKK
ncbi:MAG: PAS domain S-box protein, partial [Bacteroidetes bacterium]|nr:PAS domain S-box protein [Bacteroidota bacterium]